MLITVVIVMDTNPDCGVEEKGVENERKCMAMAGHSLAMFCLGF